MAHDLALITDLAAEHGVSSRTLRFYEERGLLKPARIGMIRYYSAADRLRLALIMKGKRLGFSLIEIETLLSTVTESAQPATAEVASLLTDRQIAAQLTVLRRSRDDAQAAIDELERALQARRRVAP